MVKDRIAGLMRRQWGCLLLLVFVALVALVARWAWLAAHNLVRTQRLASTTRVEIVFNTYEGDIQAQPVATLTDPAEIGRLVNMLNRPLHFQEGAAPGCGDWFRITFTRAGDSGYQLSYYHRAQGGTLVRTRSDSVGSCSAPAEFHRYMAELIQSSLALDESCCQ